MSERSRALGVLAAALVLSMTTWFSASAVVPQLRTEWNLSSTGASWLTIAVQLGFVGGALASSLLNLADVFSPRSVILAGSLGAAVANVLLAAAGGAGLGTPLRLATGFFLAGVYPPALKLMATWFRRGRGLALGTIVGALTLGSALPHLVNGLGGLDWRTVIYATSGLTLAGGLVARFGVADGPFPFPRAVFDPRQARLVFANRGCVAGGLLGDRWGRPQTTAAMMVASGSCAVAIGLVAQWSAWLALAIGLVWGFTVVADSAQFSTIVTELADQAYVGTALTLQLAVGFTLTVATIWLIPVLEHDVGWKWAFAFLAPGPALGTLAMLRLRQGAA